MVDWAFNDLQQYERGLADCKASIVLQPRYSYAYQNLGNSLVGLGDVPSGIAAFTKSIELKPDFIYSYFSRARAFAALGNKGMAKKDFEHALTIDPTSQEAKDAIASLDNHLQPRKVSRNQNQHRRPKQPIPGLDSLCPFPATCSRTNMLSMVPHGNRLPPRIPNERGTNCSH
jgi:tetratricopeptide (TPR) repeat protein